MVNPFSGGQSIGGGAYKGTPYDSGTGRPIIRSGGGGGSSRSTPETSVVVRDINNGRGAEVIINGQGYSVLPGQVESFLKARGLSGGSYNQALEIARARDAEFAKEQMRILEAQKQAEAEKRRIEQLAVEIRRQGAQERQKILMNEKGERVRQTITEIKKIDKGKSTNALVWKYENLDTGEVRYRSYEGSGRRNIGGVDFAQQSSKQVQEIKNELTEAGLKPIVSNGQVVGFSDPRTLRNYDYSDSGIEEFNQARSDRDQMLEITRSGKLVNRIVDKISSFAGKGDKFINNVAGTVKNIVSNLLSNAGINIKDSRVSNYISKVAVQLKNKGIDNINKYRTYVESRRDEALKNMRSTKPNLKEPKTLTQVNKWIRSFDKYVSNRAILTALNLGVTTPQLINQLRQAPFTTIALLPGGIKDGFVQDFKTIRSGDLLGITNLATDYLVYTATFGVAKAGVKATSRGIMKVLPGTKRLVDGKIVVRKAPAEVFRVRYGGSRGKAVTKFLKSRVQKPSIRRPIQTIVDKFKGRKPGQFRKFTKDGGLTLKSQTVSSGSMNFAKQFKQFSGKQVQAVNASANQLTSLIRRRKIIRKPFNLSGLEKRFPKGELSFPSEIRRLLAKFDSGRRLSVQEFIKVNGWLQKNIAKNVTLLERSLYLDPVAGLRVSRLGIQKEGVATLRDVIRGNFKLFGNRNKPQILVFEKARVANAPTYIKRIVAKIDSKGINYKGFNRDLAELVKWQTKTGTGLFKAGGSPIYAGGRELEITLAPGELIRRVKSLGRVYIDGRKVSIVSAEVFKPSRAILKQMRLAELGRLSKGAVNKLNNFLSKKLGRKVRVETPELTRSFARRAGRMARRADPNIPVLRVRGSGVVFLRAGFRGLVARPSVRMPVRFSGRVTGGVVRGGRVTGRTSRPGERIGKTTPRGRVVGRTTRISRPVRDVRRMGRLGRGRGTTQKPIPQFRLTQGFRPQQLSRPVQTFYVVEKVRGKFRKLYPKPLTMKDARDYAVYSIDNNLSRTAFFIPLGRAKRVVRPPKNIQNYASRNSFKVRPYRIRFGKRRQLVNGYIEKRRFFQDTSGERNALRVTRKISPQRRRQLIRQLQKARMRRFGNRSPQRNQMRRQVRVRPVRRTRRISPQQRRILIARLKRARAVRMRMLRRRR